MSAKRERPEGTEEEESKQQCLESEYNPAFVTIKEYAEQNPKEETLLHVVSQDYKEREIYSEHVRMLAKHLATFFEFVKKYSALEFLYELVTDEKIYKHLHTIRNSSEEELESLFGEDYDEYELTLENLKKCLSTLPENDSFLDNPVIKTELMDEFLRFRDKNKKQLGFTGFTTYIFFDRGNF